MIAGEEEFVLIQKGHTAGGMAWDRDGLKVGGKVDRVGFVHDPFGSGYRIGIGSMDDPFRAEVFGVLVRVGHIVLVRKEDISNAALLLEDLDEMLDVARGIDQPVAVWMFDEKAVGAKRFLRVEAAIRDPVFEMERKTPHRGLQSRFVTVLRADRPNGAGEERLIRPMNLVFIFRLMADS
jgi:hypothetical protein